MFAHRSPEQPGNGLEPGSDDSAVAREVDDVAHPEPWGWKTALHLWTKSIAAGVLLVAALLLGWDPDSGGMLLNILCPALTLCALGAAMALLVLDLKRPGRFFHLLAKPNFRSWPALGAYVPMAYGALSAAWLLSGIFAGNVPKLLTWLTAVLGLASAGSSAFLFAQAKRRGLWQGPLFLWHPPVRAFTAGAATLLIASMVILAGPGLLAGILKILLISLSVSLVMVLTEIALPHVDEDVRLAVKTLAGGKLRARFWGLAIGAGLVVPALLIALMLFSAMQGAGVLVAAVLALAGGWWYEDVRVKAGQSVPWS